MSSMHHQEIVDSETIQPDEMITPPERSQVGPFTIKIKDPDSRIHAHDITGTPPPAPNYPM